MSENKDNKLTLINEKTANDYLTHTRMNCGFTHLLKYAKITLLSAQKCDTAQKKAQSEHLSLQCKD